jgi:hypothetical protein
MRQLLQAASAHAHPAVAPPPHSQSLNDSFTKHMAQLKALALNVPPLYFVFELKLI